MASRNEDLYGYYLMAHIYSGGNCGDIAPQQMGRQSYPSADVRGNDAKAAVALGQMHGRAGTEALSMERLVATVEGMVGVDPERTGDLSAAKAAMSELAKVAESMKPGACKVTVENMAGGEAKQPNAGDLADMKAGTQGLGVVTEKVVEVVSTAGGGVAEQTTYFPRVNPPSMGDVWEPRLGGPPITLMFFDPTCFVDGAWRIGYGDKDYITTEALRLLYERKLAPGGCLSFVEAAAIWMAVRAKVTYTVRVADLVLAALGPKATMPEIKAAVSALALAEKSAASAK